MSTLSNIYRSADNVYLNISFQPEYMSGISSILEYNVTKDTPILDKMSDYYASVIRFDIPLGEVPLVIFPVIPNQGNPNLSSLIIGITYNGISYPQNLIYVPVASASLSPPPVQNQPTQVVTNYYYIYSYDWMMQIINNALKASYNASGLNLLFPGVVPPFFYYEPTSQIISLVVPDFFVQPILPGGIPEISTNYVFYQFLEGFPWFQNGFNIPNGFDQTMKLSIGGNITTENGYALFGVIPIDPPQYYKVSQSGSYIQYWNPIKKILLTSDSIPISKEFVQGAGTSFSNPSLPIITDFTPVVENANDSRSIAYYLPTAEYRKVDLISDLSLTKISMRVYWEDIYGNLNQLYIGSHQQANVKMVFLNKSMYKGNPIQIENGNFSRR